nr:cell wall protein RBR3-like [Procambarus clarkii]
MMDAASTPAPPSPPPSPTPSSSDDAPHISHTPSAASLVSSSPAPSTSSRCKSSSASCPGACPSYEPASSTSNPPQAGESTAGCSSCEVTSASLQDTVSSRHRVESQITLDPPSSSLHFSPEVSSSNLGLDETYLGDVAHSCTPGASGSASPRAPDSSEAASGSHFRSSWQPRSSCPNLAVASSSGWPQECLRPTSESLVSRSTWLTSPGAGTPSSWHSGAYWGTLEASDVSSTEPPDSTKSNMGACQAGWQRDYPGAVSHELTSSTAVSRDTVNSTVEEGAASSSWCQEEEEGATGAAAAWECDSLSCEVGATSSLTPWPSSSCHIPPPNSPVNSTSQCPAESSLQLPTWRSRASSAPLSLTRVMPTAPPPRPPTPPRQHTPPASRHRASIPPPAAVRRSASPPARSHGRGQSPPASRRSVSPPQQHQSQHQALPVRRSASPPLRHHAAQHPRRSVSPVSFQGTLGHPLSPTVRRRPRHRSARTPSPRPPRPPNSTPEPGPSPSQQQQSPRPHYTKMRGR